MHLETQFVTSLIPVGFSFAYTLVLCLFAQPVARVLRLLDEPSVKVHSRHRDPTPLVGGLAVLAPIVVLGLAAPLLAGTLARDGYWDLAPKFGASVGVMAILGMLDDRYHLSARLRLIVAAVTFLGLVQFNSAYLLEGISVPFLGSVISLAFGPAAVLVTVLCLVALANAINMADGRNGLVIGMSLIWTLTFLQLTPVTYPGGLFVLLSGLAVVFVFNLRGRLFLGDGGTYGLATLFGLTALWMYNLPEPAISATQVACLFLIPGLDMVRLIQVRLRSGRSPFAADHQHLHHYLDDWIGWGAGLPVYLGLVALPIAVAVGAPAWGGEAVVLGAALYLVILRAAQRGAMLARVEDERA